MADVEFQVGSAEFEPQLARVVYVGQNEDKDESRSLLHDATETSSVSIKDASSNRRGSSNFMAAKAKFERHGIKRKTTTFVDQDSEEEKDQKTAKVSKEFKNQES